MQSEDAPIENVRIDPEFRAAGTRRRGQEHSGPRWVAIAAVALVGTVLWSLLSSPSGASAERANATAEEIAAIVDRSPLLAPTMGRTSPGGLSGVPLQEAVPGFVDTITALTASSGGVEVLRWVASESAPATLLTVDHDDAGRDSSVDASGRWFIQIRSPSSPTIYAVTDDNPRSHEPRVLSNVASGAKTWSAAWHDTEPGRLAWLTCAGESPGSATELHLADLSNGRTPSVAVVVPNVACRNGGVSLAQWGDWGVLLNAPEGAATTHLLLDSRGTPVAEGRRGAGGASFRGIGPAGTTVWSADSPEAGVSSYLVSRSGTAPTPLPGPVRSEGLERALASPDGSLLALVHSGVAESLLWIVEIDTNEVIAEIEESNRSVDELVWSTDSRFLVYERRPAVEPDREGRPDHGELVFYDTKAAGTTAFPLRGDALALRTDR